MKMYRVFLWVMLLGYTAMAGAADVKPDMTVMVPMRDGEELPMDLFLPADKEGAHPCILIRTPRSRAVTNPEYSHMAEWGYVVAIQDTRNVVDADGSVLPYMSDGWGSYQDGYDTVEWLARQPYCNGKIGTVGRSALGITQLLMAPTAPEALRCQYISIAAPSLFHYAIYVGGQLRKHQVEGWLGHHSKSDAALGMIVQQPFYNELWEQLDAQQQVSSVNTPALHYGGWYDTFSQGTIDAFVARQYQGADGARERQKLVMGPWHHHNMDTDVFGDFTLPSMARQLPEDLSEKRWLDHFLKEENNGLDQTPSIFYYVMGPLDGSPSKGNVWRTASHWPIPANETNLYLTKDGKLSFTSNDSPSLFAYDYDPNDPTPTVGGRNLFIEAGPKDQRKIEQRSDVVVFTSDPLAEDLEVTGRVTAKVLFSSNQQDTDVVIRLTDVYPDGKSVLVADGISRLAVNLGEKELEKFQKGEPVEVDVDLWSTSMVFAKGHQIRVSVSSANYPRFEKNLNLGLEESHHHATPKVARNQVHVGSVSRLVLPVVTESTAYTSSVNEGQESDKTHS